MIKLKDLLKLKEAQETVKPEYSEEAVFKFFGKKVMGAKDGKLVTIEEVSDEFKKQLKELDDKDTLPRFSFWFSVKK
jgi:hypothetical protein